MRRGVTIVELLTVVTVVGILLGLALPRIAGWTDRIAVNRASTELASFYNRARFGAIFRSTRVRLEFTADSLVAIYEGARGDSTFLQWPGPSRHHVSLRASRPVIRIYPTGIGYGAANTKLVVQRGAAAESLTTSRIGRIKRWH
jgi:prepilin-type N-terminal cleavage/methylation domain-containing protein